MINKKLILLLVFVLVFLLHVSFVSAESNETDTIEINDNYEISANNISDSSTANLDYNRGDKIPITIDSPVEGSLTVLIDDEEYDLRIFSKSDTIFIETYNPESFNNKFIRNIDVGTHNLSLVFNFIDYGRYVPVVSKDGSGLKFQFLTDDEGVSGNSFIYNSTLSVREIEKTIHVTLDNEPTYYLTGIDFIVRLDNISRDEMVNSGKHSGYFGIIISEGSFVFYKEDVDIREAFETRADFVDGVPRTYLQFSFPFPYITYDVVRKLDVCNFTVVNLADGTQDSFLFNVSKFDTQYPEKIEYAVNGSAVTYYFYHYFTEIYVSVGDIHKFVTAGEYNCDYGWNMTFTNLKAGTHVINLYHHETDFIKQFSYNITFEIKDFHHNDLPNSVNIIGNNVSFNMFPNLDLIENNAFLFFNSGSGVFDVQEIIIDDNSGLSDNESSFDGDLKITGDSPSVGDDVGGSSSHESSTKAHEISKKSVSKSTDNVLARLGITIISCMLFMVGYVKFKKN